MDDTMVRLQGVFRQVFDSDELSIDPTTTASELADWDSFNHVNLVLAVEREFGVRLPSADVVRLKNVGQLADFLDGMRSDRS